MAEVVIVNRCAVNEALCSSGSPTRKMPSLTRRASTLVALIAQPSGSKAFCRRRCMCLAFLLTLACVAKCGAQEDLVFIVPPYVQLGDAPALRAREQLAILWHTLDGAESNWGVEFQQAGGKTWTPAASLVSSKVAADGIAVHFVYEATLSGLQPGSEIDYRIRHRDKLVFSARTRARKSADQPYRFVVMGDVGTGSMQQKKVAYQVAQHNPDFIYIPGDIVYSNGRISEYRPSFYAPYSPDKASPQAGAPLLRSTLFLAGLGQHDSEASLSNHPDAFGYYLYWSQPLNGPEVKPGNWYPLGGSSTRQQSFLKSAGRRHPRMASYSFDYGNSHWTTLDSWNPHMDWNDAAHRAWLKEDLAKADKAVWKFVGSYLPPFNSSTAYPKTQKMRVVAGLLQDAAVDIVFSGYAHSYQRTFPLRFFADPMPQGAVKDPGHKIPGRFAFDKKFDGKTETRPDGVLYIVSGGGGNPGLHSPEQTDNPKSWQPFTTRYHASLNQFTLVEIEGKRLTLRQISLDGEELDRLVITK